ncbi:hypothetical protein L1887_34911 [Cichorium endivia]|nr:hypothetical protein L1887_34911 [Cichorium endivia]
MYGSSLWLIISFLFFWLCNGNAVDLQTERECKRGDEYEVTGDWTKESTMRLVMSLSGFRYLLLVFFFNVVFALSLLSIDLEMEKNGGMFSLLSWF